MVCQKVTFTQIVLLKLIPFFNVITDRLIPVILYILICDGANRGRSVSLFKDYAYKNEKLKCYSAGEKRLGVCWRYLQL